jgi:hypothetical protein
MEPVMTSTITENVVRKHLETFLEQKGIPAILADYDDAARLYSTDRVYEGHEEIRAFLAAFLRSLPDGAYDRFELGSLTVNGELAFITWSVGNDIPLGADTFIVRDGKIVAQTVAMHIPEDRARQPRNAGKTPTH